MTFEEITQTLFVKETNGSFAEADKRQARTEEQIKALIAAQTRTDEQIRFLLGRNGSAKKKSGSKSPARREGRNEGGTVHFGSEY